MSREKTRGFVSRGGRAPGPHLRQPGGEGASVERVDNQWWTAPVDGWKDGYIDMRDARTDKTVRIYLREKDAHKNEGIFDVK